MGRVSRGIDNGGMEVGVIDGVEGSVSERGVYEKVGTVGTLESNAVQLKSTQQPWTPLMTTQLRRWGQ